ncbi:MAG: ribonuclease R family protein [Gammaproteobacteria bacterium]
MKENFKAKVFLNKSGRGRVKYSEDEFLSLSNREMFKVFPGDEVVCQKMPGSKAKIKEVLKRNTSELTGIIKKYKGKTFLTSLDKSFHLDILLEGKNLKNFKSNDICEVKITSQPSLKYKPKAKPIKTLKSNDVFEEAFIFATNGTELSTEWSKSIINDCNKIKRDVSSQDINSRKDLRRLNFVTIDGSNAKDFDDAVYAEESSDGFLLYVAIADVSEYVLQDSSLDKEAFSRATSVYFEKKVIPMLPELISNKLCSLRPNEDKLVLTCEIYLDKEGEIKSFEFFKSVICSKNRLTYDEVEKFYQKGQTALSDDIVSNLSTLKKIHALRRKIREERKAIDFYLPEYRPVGKDNKIIKFKSINHLLANEVIEESMILANICAAKLTKKLKKPIPFRHHDNPDYNELEKLKEFLKARGLRKSMTESNPREKLRGWLKEINQKEKSFSLIYQILRSMKLAVYSGKESNHFALGLDEYCHFTSPIRRYSDLVTHRVIKSIIEKKGSSYSQNEIDEIATVCSEKDREAEKIVRESSKYLSCKCAEQHIGKEFNGEIVAVLEFGVFMHIDELNIEGFCHIKNLKRSPYYVHDATAHSLTSANKNNIYALGDKFKIKIKSVETSRKRIDLKVIK